MLRHRIAGAGFYQANIGGVDRAIGIHVVAEISLIDRGTLLCFRLRDIGRVYDAIAVRVGRKNDGVYCGIRQGLAEGVNHLADRDGDQLLIGHSGQVDRHRVIGENRAAGNRAGATCHAGVTANDIVGEGEDKGVISASAAAFHANIAGEWKIDIEHPRGAVGFARDDAGDLQRIARIGHRRLDLHRHRRAGFEEANGRRCARGRFVRIKPEVIQCTETNRVCVWVL